MVIINSLLLRWFVTARARARAAAAAATTTTIKLEFAADWTSDKHGKRCIFREKESQHVVVPPLGLKSIQKEAIFLSTFTQQVGCRTQLFANSVSSGVRRRSSSIVTSTSDLFALQLTKLSELT